MMGVMAAAVVVVAMLCLARLVLTTVTAGIQGRAAPVRVLDGPARMITVKSQMLALDDEYRRVVAEDCGG